MFELSQDAIDNLCMFAIDLYQNSVDNNVVDPHYERLHSIIITDIMHDMEIMHTEIVHENGTVDVGMAVFPLSLQVLHDDIKQSVGAVVLSPRARSILSALVYGRLFTLYN